MTSNRFVKACLLICTVVLIAIALELFPTPNQVSAAKIPQYTVTALDTPRPIDLQSALDKYAKEGWTLRAAPVSVFPGAPGETRSVVFLIFTKD